MTTTPHSRLAIIAACSLVALPLIGASAGPATSAAESGSAFIYETDGDCGSGGSIRITGYEGDVPAELEIPGSIDGHTVSSVASAPVDGATGFDHASISSVSLPSSLVCIGPQTFAGNRISSLELPGSLRDIATGSFADNEIATLTVSGDSDTLGSPLLAQSPSLTVTRPSGDAVIALNDIINWASNGHRATWDLADASSLPDGVTWDAERQGFHVSPDVTSFTFTPTMVEGYDGFGSTLVDVTVSIAADPAATQTSPAESSAPESGPATSAP